MSDKTTHGTASVSRDSAAAPGRVFARFADPRLRDRRFRMLGSTGVEAAPDA